MTSKSEHYIDTKEIVATEIIAKIPAGYRDDYMESVESPDGGTTIRIHIKKKQPMTSKYSLYTTQWLKNRRACLKEQIKNITAELKRREANDK